MSPALNRKKQLKNISLTIIFYSFLILIIILSSLNINNYFSDKNDLVLGTQTTVSNEDFWKEFLSENDNYIPGWVEIGRLDKASQIDPNYFLK